jgi:hypothetical protein
LDSHGKVSVESLNAGQVFFKFGRRD